MNWKKSAIVITFCFGLLCILTYLVKIHLGNTGLQGFSVGFWLVTGMNAFIPGMKKWAGMKGRTNAE